MPQSNHTAMKLTATLAFLVLIFPVAARCQQLPSLNILLDRLDAYAKQYQATLPSFACDEQITSEVLSKKGKVTWQVKAQSILREIRTGDPFDPFLEKREFKKVDGRHPRPTFRASQMPYFVEGGFGALVGFKRWEQRECFDYHVSAGEDSRTFRLEMTLKAEVPNPSCARLPLGLARVVIADLETGRILHTERTIDPSVATSTEVYFGAMDYAPYLLGDKPFWLPSQFFAHDAQKMARMVATYSNCHRYTGELKLLPDWSPAGASPEPR